MTEDIKKRPVYISIVAQEDRANTSFFFGGATVAQLSMLNHELDIIKKDIVKRIEGSPKEWEVEELDG